MALYRRLTKRVTRVGLRFQDATERRKVLFHRLFKKSPSAPSPEIDAIIRSYINTWKRFDIPMPSDYAEQLRDSFPFTPELLDVALVRISQSKGGFQSTRGALGFLAALVRSCCQATHLITMADASMLDSELRSWLADLDPSQNLLTCAESNLNELRSY
jgi:predicted AAA+ superfamily ATPase